MPRKKAEKQVEEQEEFDVDEPSEIEELDNNATDDDWTPADDEKKQPGRPQRASRNRKPIKLADGKSSDDDEEEEEEEDVAVRGGGIKRKRGSNTAVRGGGRGRGRGRGGGGSVTPAAKKPKADENGKGRGGKKKTSAPAPPAAPEGEGDEDEMDDLDDEEGMEDDEESVSDEDDSDEDSTAEDDAEIPEQFKSGKFVLLKSDFDNKEENYPIWKIDGKSLLQKFDKYIHNNEELYKGTTIYAGWSKAIISTYYPINVEYKTIDQGESSVKFDASQITPEMQKSKSTTPSGGEGDDELTTKEEPLGEDDEAEKADPKAETGEDEE